MYTEGLQGPRPELAILLSSWRHCLPLRGHTQPMGKSFKPPLGSRSPSHWPLCCHWSELPSSLFALSPIRPLHLLLILTVCSQPNSKSDLVKRSLSCLLKILPWLLISLSGKAEVLTVAIRPYVSGSPSLPGPPHPALVPSYHSALAKVASWLSSNTPSPLPSSRVLQSVPSA